jgi:predicted ATP-grasp superfamily ATP-dependent carboligase
MTQRTVIITDGDQRAALAVVRSLGHEYRCVVTASSRSSLAGQSRFSSHSVVVPDALERPNEFADAIVALAADEQAAVVLPITEPAMLAILGVRSRLAPAVVPFPDLPTFKALTDKQRLLDEASKLGISVPAQTIVPARIAAVSMDFHGLQYPIVLKPSRSVSENGKGRAKFSVSYAADESELRYKIRLLPPAAFPLLLQQRITGPGMGIFLLIWDGEQRAQFAHRRLCEKPPSGGVSVYCESVAINEDLRDRSRALLDHFGWRGVAMVEYKRDATTGRCYLMEVNGRFWGSLQLAIDAGVDFPRLLVASALGDRFKPQASYRIGVRSRWWWGQVDHLIGRVPRRTRAGPLPPGTVTARRALADLLLAPFRRGDYEEVLSWDDPRPFWNETIRWMSAL